MSQIRKNTQTQSYTRNEPVKSISVSSSRSYSTSTQFQSRTQPQPTVDITNNGFSSDDDSNPIVCNCNEPAVLLTVRKDGPNQGKQFYKCAKGQNQGLCDFFIWAEGAESTRVGTTPTRPISNQMSSRSQQFSDKVNCNCNEEAKL